MLNEEQVLPREAQQPQVRVNSIEEPVQEEPELPDEERPLLIIDDREPKDRIAEVGRRRVYRTEVKRLDVGDLLLGDNAFEFKMTADFISSIMDGRIAQQTAELALNFPGKAFLVICGTLQEVRYSRPQWRYRAQEWAKIEASYRGAVWSILEKREVAVLFVKDVREFCEFLVAKAKRMQRGAKTVERPMVTLKGSDRTIKEEKEDVLAAMTGIGREAARGLLAHFLSVEKVVAATVKELSQAPGIGPVRAAHLHSVLH